MVVESLVRKRLFPLSQSPGSLRVPGQQGLNELYGSLDSGSQGQGSLVGNLNCLVIL
jgi:hypothetical protein